jgi:signal transduction histidine kinase/CheY-like chemotaxis protein
LEISENFAKIKEKGRGKSEVRLKCKNESVIWVSLHAVKLSEDRFMAFCSDISETKRLQALEARAQRLETAGQIAGQVAHDFNNLLGPLVAYPELIKEDLPNTSELHDMIDAMYRASIQISEINQQLLTLGRRGHYNLEPLDLNKVIEQIISQSKYKSEKLIIRKELCSELMNIKGGESQLLRVISNIIQNACDAMQNVGELYIKTENFYLDRPHKKLSDIPIGEYIKVTVTDTGSGISSEMLPKIFDPFFSTKKTDKRRGSGLGLSVVHAVIKDHDGYIDVESELGQGTSFYLYFPITREVASSDEDETVLTGTERILIVDDDRVQRDVTITLLSKLGYFSYGVESGEEALQIIKREDFDLILLDMIMPGGMNGTETLKKILELIADQKAIIISCYAESDNVRESISIGAGAFIRKPLTLKAIASAIRQELDKDIKITTKE